MASTSRHASSTYGVTPTVGGSTIVHSTAAADEDQSPIDREAATRSPVDVSRYPTVYEQNVEELHPQGYSRPPSAAQPRYSVNVSRMSTYRVESPNSDVNYPSWLPRRPLAPQPPGSTDGGYTGNRASSAGGYYGGNGGGGRLADLFNFSRGHSRNVTQSSNRVSTAMSGFITNPSEYGGPPGRKMTDDSGRRKETDDSGATSYGQVYSPGRRHSSGDYDPRTGARRNTPRSVRIAPGSVDHGRGQEPTDQTRRASSSAAGYGYAYGRTSGHPHGYTHVRGFSRGAVNPYAAAMSQSPLALEPPHTGWMSVSPQSIIPAPRFHARNLNLSLLRSPSKIMMIRYLFQPATYFAHVPVQLFFDFNVVYILVQITKFPNPLAPGVANTTPSPNWLFALIAYLLATVLWLIGVVVIYEVAWCFWRRWRVKRPGMLGIFSSRPARKLVGMGSYERFCFLEYVQRGAWTDRTELDLMLEREKDIKEDTRERRREADEHESMGGGWEGKKALQEARAAEAEAQAQEGDQEDTVDENDEADEEPRSWFQRVKLLNYRQGFVEWAWNRSQNLPTVALLVPRACIAFILLLTFSSINPLTQAAINSGQTSPSTSGPTAFGTPANVGGLTPSNSPTSRDETFFSATDGTLSGYARAVLWINCAWALWRTVLLIVAYVSLWIASGQSCAGVCGPRFRWEEMERQEWEDATNAGLAEKYGSGSRRHLSLSGDSTIGGIDKESGDIADQLGWQWRENTRRRVREAYEFCLLAPLPRHRHRASIGAPGAKETNDSQSPTNEPLTGLEQALLASRHAGRKGLAADLFKKPSDAEGMHKDSHNQLAPPAHHLHLSTPDPKGRGGPISQLPYPFPAYQSGGPIPRRDSVPFPSEHGDNEQARRSHVEEELIDDEEGEGYPEEGDYHEGEVDEMGYLPQRPASASLSSLGQPIPSHSRLQYITQRTRSSGSYYSPRTSGYKSTSSKSNSGDQTSPRRKSSGKSSGSQYSPRTKKSSGSQQSPNTDSSNNKNSLANILPPPISTGQRPDRRRTAASGTHLPTIMSPVDVNEHGQLQTMASRQAGYQPGAEPEPEFEEEEGPLGQGPGAAAEFEGFPEEEGGDHENEDSIGLLSKTPSHQGSLAAIRQRASSLTNSIHRLRTRSQGASSNSNSNSGSGTRSRTRSLAAGAAGGAPSGRPESHAMSSLGTGSGSGSPSRSRTSSLVPQIGARYTSQRPSEFGEAGGVGSRWSEYDDGEEGGGGSSEQPPPVPLIPESALNRGVGRIRAESTAPSERTIQQQQQQQQGRVLVAHHRNVSIEQDERDERHQRHPDAISEARESLVTLPPSVHTGSTSRPRRGGGPAESSSQTVSTWANVPGYLHDQHPYP